MGIDAFHLGTCESAHGQACLPLAVALALAVALSVALTLLTRLACFVRTRLADGSYDTGLVDLPRSLECYATVGAQLLGK